MVVLGVVELGRVHDLGRDLAVAGLAQPLAGSSSRDAERGLALRVRGHVDPGAVLGADVVALAHALGRVVALPEQAQQLVVGDLLRAVDHEHDLVVAGAPAADLLVGGVRRVAAGVADRRRVDARRLPEAALGAPEAAQPEDRASRRPRGTAARAACRARSGVSGTSKGRVSRPGRASSGAGISVLLRKRKAHTYRD